MSGREPNQRTKPENRNSSVKTRRDRTDVAAEEGLVIPTAVRLLHDVHHFVLHMETNRGVPFQPLLSNLLEPLVLQSDQESLDLVFGGLQELRELGGRDRGTLCPRRSTPEKKKINHHKRTSTLGLQSPLGSQGELTRRQNG